MVRCPVCGSTQITIVLSEKSHGSCSACGARWLQEGGEQRAVERAGRGGRRVPAEVTGATPWVRF